MDESSEIKSIPLEDFDIRYSSICQKKDSKGLASTANRRSKLFVLPVDHHCYKKYVFKKTIEKIMILIFLFYKNFRSTILIPFEETQYLNRYLLYLFLFA